MPCAQPMRKQLYSPRNTVTQWKFPQTAIKTGEQKLVACVVLATTRLDVNKRVRKKISARKVYFATQGDTLRFTGMELGGVTPLRLALPNSCPSESMPRSRRVR